MAPYTPLGTLKTLGDGEAGATPFRYSLVPGEGDDDNEGFWIVGDRLWNRMTLEFETQPRYLIRVRAVGANGLILEQAFVITQSGVEALTADQQADSSEEES